MASGGWFLTFAEPGGDPKSDEFGRPWGQGTGYASTERSVGEADLNEARVDEAQLRLLGGFALRRHGAFADLPAAGRRLLAFLALHRGARSRVQVAGTLWPEHPEVQAQANLRSALWRLRRSCPDVLKTSANDVALAPAVRVDLHECEDEARQLIGGAVATAPLPTGELLPGWYDDWVVVERERLRQLQLHGLEALAVTHLRAHRHAEALDAALGALVLEPLRESAYRLVVHAHLAEGNLVEAFRQYDVCRALFRAELGVEPSNALRSLLPVSRRSAAPAKR